MPEYSYECNDCEILFDVTKSMSEATNPANCPKCNIEIKNQKVSGKRIGGFTSTEGNWTGGKKIIQLHPNHPDAVVTSKKQMEDAYIRNGISMDTGHYVSREAQIKGTVPRNRRQGVSDDHVVGGVQEES
tara:strand:+ start:1243 stop:1632 length:390 start_codon:yes stop_codon:yes gene_type:complete